MATVIVVFHLIVIIFMICIILLQKKESKGADPPIACPMVSPTATPLYRACAGNISVVKRGMVEI